MQITEQFPTRDEAHAYAASLPRGANPVVIHGLGHYAVRWVCNYIPE